jgi:Cft2 family RNA processing exonuclease
MRLSFLGAAAEVTGSCYLVETASVRFIVDCGMFQGGREASEKNYAQFAFDPRALDFMLLTHAHIDHSGLLPRLVAAGFRGQVFTTRATVDLLRVMLLDSAHIQEKEAECRERAQRRGNHEERKHPEPLYTVAEAETRQGELPDLQIYVDSPLATHATEITLKHRALLDPEARNTLTAMLAPNGRPRVVFVEDVAESMALDRIRSGALIISASGMCDAGRIKHHLAHNLGRKECTVVITGFQAQGTLGRHIVDGAASVRIFGEDVPVRAEVYTIGGLSAHADQAGLLAWLRNFQRAPRQAFIVHGEADTAQIFCDTVRAQLGWKATVPAAHSTATL